MDFTNRHIRLDILLRTALILQPAETARLLSSRTELRSVMSRFGHVCLKPWYHADSAGALAWIREAYQENSYLLKNLAEYLFRLDPAEFDRFLASIKEFGEIDMNSILLRIAHHDPAAARDVAARHGLSFPETSIEQERLLQVEHRPDRMLAEFLQSLPHHPLSTDLNSMGTSGWSEPAIYELAVRVAMLLPEQAPRLAAVLPASFLAARFAQYHRYASAGRPRDALLRFWPELHETIPADSSANRSFGCSTTHTTD